MIYARIGAALYLIWGLLHFVAAINVYSLGQTLEQGMVQGRIFQGAWNLLFFAVVSSVIAILFNWKNSRMGYWLNLIVVSAADLGFVITILLPGYLPVFPSVIALVLWLLAIAFTTIGIRSKNA